MLSADQVFARALPVLRQHRALFKVPATAGVLAYLNSGDGGYSQIGKFITVYPTSDAEAREIARKLDRATRGLPAPKIPFDQRYRRDGIVYYRYGSFAPGVNGAPAKIRDAHGKLHVDRRRPGAAVPAWLQDPFRSGTPKRARASGPIGRDYLVIKALAQRGKGAVFEAVEIAASPARLVVIKQGLRHGDTDWLGDDGYSRVRRERRTLRALRAAGLPVPKVLRQFTNGGNAYLVLEKIPGRPLLPLGREQPAKPSWARAETIRDRVAPLLSRMHAAGWVWRDCKPHHIFSSRSGLHMLDFEGACPIDETDLLPWGSPPYVPPRYLGKFSRRAGTFEDDYALGVMLFQFGTGGFPPRSARARAARYRETGCPVVLRRRVESLLRG